MCKRCDHVSNFHAFGSIVHTSNVGMDGEGFYTDAKAYWEGIPATVNGVMGGFSNLSSLDAASSRKFISPFIKGPGATVSTRKVLDCGAGIGRVSKRLLLPLFDSVDMEEQNPAFLKKAEEYLGESYRRVGECFPIPLQDFTPRAATYDVIWCQWVLSHLKHVHLVEFLKRCIQGLVQSTGIIIVKENISKDQDDFDSDDSSVTRCMESFKLAFAEAGLTVIKEENQDNWPDNMFQITMFALVPAGSAVVAVSPNNT